MRSDLSPASSSVIPASPWPSVEFELAWAPHLLATMDYTYRERHGEAIYRFKGLPSQKRGDGIFPSDFFRRNVLLSFQEDAIGIRLPPPFPPPQAGEGQGGGSTT